MNIKTNSKNIKSGDIFVAINGYKKNGNDYIDEALSNGASLIITDDKGKISDKTLVVDNTSVFLKEYISSTYYSYIDNMIFIGVTGTNGKTTTAFLIYQLLKKFNENVSYIGTLGFYMDDKVCDLDNTTPDIITMYDLILKSLKNNIKIVVMEVSSHSLSQDRLYGIKFDYVVFTNISSEHMDYHITMDNYLDSKKKLFKKVKDKHLKLVNVDSPYSSEFVSNNTITYGFNNSDYKVLNYKLFLDKTKYTFLVNDKKYNVSINIPGKYNIYNSLIPIIILRSMGYKYKKIISSLKKIKMPPGRMQIISKDDKYVIIDYAHTPDAVSNVLSSAKEFAKGSIYTIIGCGGDRDKTKRKDMALISVLNSDYSIFTNDNPRGEDELSIINDMTKSLNTYNYEVILDRSSAIKKGISLLKKNDVLFLLGKGHEDYQIVKDCKYYFSDYEEVIKYLN